MIPNLDRLKTRIRTFLLCVHLVHFENASIDSVHELHIERSKYRSFGQIVRVMVYHSCVLQSRCALL